jgi:HAD superfamily hydrolase (TIGR01549 family)
MIRAVLFDLDDTLVDHQYASRAALAGVRERFPAFQKHELDDLIAENQRILDSIHHDVALGARDVADARIERYRRLFAYAGHPDARAGAAAELHRRVYQANRRCVEGALELMTLLRARLRVAVVTNNTVAEQTEKLATFGFAPMVDALVTSEEIGAAKPDPRIFRAALERLQCERARSGDDRRRVAARTCGAHRRRHSRAVAQSATRCRIRTRRRDADLALHPAEDVAALVAPDYALLNRLV